jgi:HD superfamily phosphohydrolase YqeK
MDSNTVISLCEDWVKKDHKYSEHMIRTGYWIKQLDHNASPEMIVAGITHDIERAFTEGRKPEGSLEEGPEVKFVDPVYSLWHGRRSAELAGKYLKQNGVDDKFITEVKRLIVSHEVGGDQIQNLIKDADSISFLENNIDNFLDRIPAQLTSTQVREKFNYMYNRISSVKAKKLAKSFYQKALRELTSAYPL